VYPEFRTGFLHEQGCFYCYICTRRATGSHQYLRTSRTRGYGHLCASRTRGYGHLCASYASGYRYLCASRHGYIGTAYRYHGSNRGSNHEPDGLPECRPR